MKLHDIMMQCDICQSIQDLEDGSDMLQDLQTRRQQRKDEVTNNITTCLL